MVKIVVTENKYDPERASIEVFLDGKSLGWGGYGGEPEDNSRHRDYSWVEAILERVAEGLGAKVVFEEGTDGP